MRSRRGLILDGDSKREFRSIRVRYGLCEIAQRRLTAIYSSGGDKALEFRGARIKGGRCSTPKRSMTRADQAVCKLCG